MRILFALLFLAAAGIAAAAAPDAAGKPHVIFIIGDDEYKFDQSMPPIAKELQDRYAMQCTVLLAQPDQATRNNMPGLEALAKADLAVFCLRFRELPDEQMKYIAEYTNSGKPIVGLRTSTHAFNYTKRKDSPYAKYSCRDKTWDGGFGRQVLGETWIGHYGAHQKESTRGLVAPGMEGCPIVKGCDDIWGPSDVYSITTLTGDSKPVIMGQVLTGMNPKDPPNAAKKPVPVAWIKTFTGDQGKAARVFTTTMGHNGDFQSEGFRRLMVNASYWALGMEAQIPAKSKVDLVGEYNPSPIGMGKHKKGMKPADLKM